MQQSHLNQGSGFSHSRSRLWWWKRLFTKGLLNLGCAMLYATLTDMKSPSFSLSAEVPWLITVRHLGQSLGFACPHAAQDWKRGLILPLRGNVVPAGWRIGREVEKKGWYQSPWYPATMRAPQGRVSLLYPAPYICTKHSHLIVPLPTIANHGLSKNHTRVHTQYS